MYTVINNLTVIICLLNPKPTVDNFEKMIS